MSYILDLVYPKVKLDSTLFKLSSPRQINPFDSILPVFRYRPPLSHYLHLFKYDHQFSLSFNLAKLLAQTLYINFPHILNYWQSNNFILIPIPLHWARQNWRGFNQSDLLSKKLSTLLSLPCNANWLYRPYYHSPQVNYTRLARQKNLFSAFSLHPKSIPELADSSGNFILVDDVVTTGSTLISAIQPLLPYAKNPPWALTIAG